VILPGTCSVGNTVVAAGAVVRGEFPDHVCWAVCRPRSCATKRRERMAVGTAEWLDATSALTHGRFVSRPSSAPLIAGLHYAASEARRRTSRCPTNCACSLHSTLAVGSARARELLPLIVFGLYGGVLADSTQSTVD